MFLHVTLPMERIVPREEPLCDAHIAEIYDGQRDNYEQYLNLNSLVDTAQEMAERKDKLELMDRIRRGYCHVLHTELAYCLICKK